MATRLYFNTGIWWDFSSFNVLLSFNRHLQKSRSQHGGTEYCAMNVWSLAFILNDDHITPWGSDTYFPILIYQNYLWFSLKCCHSPAVLTNALSTPLLNLHSTTSHPDGLKQKKKEFTFIFISYELVVIHFLWACSFSNCALSIMYHII